MKKDYLRPELITVEIGDLMQVIPLGSPTDEFNDAKEQQLEFDEEEPLPVDKNIWEEENEE